MGYVERKIGSALVAGCAGLVGAALVAVGPYLAGKALAGPVLGWVFEIIYIGLIVMVIMISVRKTRQQAEREARARHEHFLYAAQMTTTGATWYDSLARHYRHGTCTVRHRSEGAAARCRSTI